MDDLPVEILDLICDLCGPREIKNLRLTCRKIRSVADGHLFPEIVVFMNRDSLETCKEVAAHSVFSNTARTLCIQADRPRRMSFSTWHEEVKDLIEGGYPASEVEAYVREEEIQLTEEQQKQLIGRLILSDVREEHPDSLVEKIEYRYAQALRLTSEAEEIMYDRSLRNCLREIFSRCTKVERVDLTMNDSMRDTTAGRNKGFRSGMLVPRSDLELRTSGLDAMIQLAMAAHEVGFKPTVLCLGDVSHVILMHGSIMIPLKAFFAELQTLRWRFANPDLEENADLAEDAYRDMLDDFENTDNCVSLLRSATRLERLELELPEDTRTESNVKLPDVLGDTVWPQLTHLQLSNFLTSPDYLKDLLLRHKSTLLDVSLGAVHLFGDEANWPDTFASFAGKLPMLQRFELSGTLGQNFEVFHDFGPLRRPQGRQYERQLCRYIIDGGQRCPPKPTLPESQDSDEDDETETEDESGDEDDEDDEDEPWDA
ncbi:unnamed protein product [Zymoseptoria tritici ST99CH_1A5]|uniref:F-box domain-containing protein n=1 Tax=Zymoseptoria tritici ST99CH_1A5 TaxID=1276529 RepID=A0A1Y6LSU2_ZYMTR|nr:unnamed protein product [Zymoseptoria tritici ST99CH_1A5]